MALSTPEVQKIIEDYRLGAADTGSPEVQIALLTARIKGLTEHFKSHKKDFGSRRGLQKLISRRRKLLDYLRAKNQERHLKLVQSLGLRYSQN